METNDVKGENAIDAVRAYVRKTWKSYDHSVPIAERMVENGYTIRDGWVVVAGASNEFEHRLYGNETETVTLCRLINAARASQTQPEQTVVDTRETLARDLAAFCAERNFYLSWRSLPFWDKELNAWISGHSEQSDPRAGLATEIAGPIRDRFVAFVTREREALKRNTGSRAPAATPASPHPASAPRPVPTRPAATKHAEHHAVMLKNLLGELRQTARSFDESIPAVEAARLAIDTLTQALKRIDELTGLAVTMRGMGDAVVSEGAAVDRAPKDDGFRIDVQCEE